MSNPIDLQSLPGLVATVCLSGSVTPQYSASHSDLRSFNDRNGWHKVEYRTFHAVLVEDGRDATVHHMGKEGYAWLLQIDADAAPFPADSVPRMLTTIYHAMPHIDVLGGYCQVKHYPYHPTIDTGSGMWEEHYPGEGIIPVIRTGCHFLMCKRAVFARTGPPWFRTRQTLTPTKAIREFDNFCRTSLGGVNPFEDHPEWEAVCMMAKKKSFAENHVGEDSAFCDKLRAAGHNIYVDTDLIVGHVSQKIVGPSDFVDAQRTVKANQAACLGLL